MTMMASRRGSGPAGSDGFADPDPASVVLLSTRDAADYGRRIGASGALGFITKSSLSGDTLWAILRGHVEEGT
jgi:hypothetical protein